MGGMEFQVTLALIGLYFLLRGNGGGGQGYYVYGVAPPGSSGFRT